MLFSAPMVGAILDGRKTQTRRALNPQPEGGIQRALVGVLNSNGNPLVCRNGQRGDRLWVKETFFAWGRWETRYNEIKGRDEWRFIDMTPECEKEYLYAADGVENSDALKDRSEVRPLYWKRPSIFMPRRASRITLKITGLRVERLHGITKKEALAEGVDQSLTPEGHVPHNPKRAFKELWQSINGPESWETNPWVWVIEFKRVETK